MKAGQILFVLCMFSRTAFGTPVNIPPDAKSAGEWYIYSGEDTPFCYNESEPCGTSKWRGLCNAANSRRQSPIELHVNLQDYFNELVPSNYDFRMSDAYGDEFTSFYMQNDGHSIQLSLLESESKKLQISYDSEGKHLYQFFRVHFHWGATNDGGSEHRVKGSSNYVMEMHVVHWSLKYESLEQALEAVEDPESVSVIGVFVELCKAKQESAFGQILKHVETVGNLPSEESALIAQPLSLRPFFPKKSLDHFSYQGSLTSPGCAEAVKWTVMEESICINQEELDAFRKVQTHESRPLDRNHRPVQAVGDRQIHFHRVFMH